MDHTAFDLPHAAKKDIRITRITGVADLSQGKSAVSVIFGYSHNRIYADRIIYKLVKAIFIRVCLGHDRPVCFTHLELYPLMNHRCNIVCLKNRPLYASNGLKRNGYFHNVISGKDLNLSFAHGRGVRRPGVDGIYTDRQAGNLEITVFIRER